MSATDLSPAIESETSTGPTASAEEVMASVTTALGAIVGVDYVADLGVGPDTGFEADLELESIEIVQLAEELVDRYGDRVDFVAWFAGMELQELIDLTVGQLVEFIVASLASGPEAG